MADLPTQLPAIMLHLESPVVALIGHDAELIQASDGFMHLLGLKRKGNTQPERIRGLFLDPDFDSLAAYTRDAGTLYRGSLSIKSPDGVGCSLRGTVQRWQDCLLIMAERDADSIGALQTRLTELNQALLKSNQRLSDANQEITSCRNIIQSLCNDDPATGLLNRRTFLQALNRELERSREYARPLSLALLRIDRFDTLDQRLGQVATGTLLRSAGARIRTLLRGIDLPAYLGDGCFAILLPEMDASEPGDLARRLAELFPDTHPPAIGLGSRLDWRIFGPEAEESAAIWLMRATDALCGPDREPAPRASAGLASSA